MTNSNKSGSNGNSEDDAGAGIVQQIIAGAGAVVSGVRQYIVRGLSREELEDLLRKQTRVLLVGGSLILLTVFTGFYFAFLRPPKQIPHVMTRLFNIAVADFGEVDDPAKGAAIESEDGRWLANFLYEKLEEHLNAIGDLSGDVEIQHEHIGFIRGDTPEARQQDAAELAQRIAADVVVYGNLDTSGVLPWFVPEIYVSPRLTGAEESYVNPVAAAVEGQTETSPFGSKLEVRLPIQGNPDNRAALRAWVIPRLEALTEFMFGLAFHKVEQPDLALKYLELARSVPQWKDEDGKEILYLWIGTALHRRALGNSGEDNPKCPMAEGQSLDDWQCAKAAYERALELNDRFARAHIGLGNLWADQATVVHLGRPLYICNNYDRAVEEYSLALDDSMEALETAHADLKAHFNTGLTYATAYRNGCGGEVYAPAVDSLERAVSAYKEDPNVLLVRRIGAKAFYHLGMVHLKATDFYQAVEAFKQAIDVAEPDDRYEETWHLIRWHAYDQMGYAYAALARAGDAARWQDAIDAFDKVIDRYKQGKFDNLVVVSSACYGLGAAYNQTEQHERALEPLEAGILLAEAAAATKAEPWQSTRWVSLLERGNAFAALAEAGETDRWSKALADYDEVISQFETGSGEVIGEIAAEAYCHAGLVHEALGDTVEAAANYRKALTTEGISQQVADVAQERLHTLGGP